MTSLPDILSFLAARKATPAAPPNAGVPVVVDTSTAPSANTTALLNPPKEMTPAEALTPTTHYQGPTGVQNGVRYPTPLPTTAPNAGSEQQIRSWEVTPTLGNYNTPDAGEVAAAQPTQVPNVGAAPTPAPASLPQKHGILHALGTVFGQSAPNVAPGQLAPPGYHQDLTLGERLGSIGRWMSGIGSAGAMAAGTPEQKRIGADYQQYERELPMKRALTQAQIGDIESQGRERDARAVMMSTTVPVDMGNGRIAYVPASQAGRVLGAQITGQFGVEKQNVANQGHRYLTIPNVGLIDTQDPSGTPKLVPGSGPMGVTVTPDIVKDYGNDPALAQMVGRTLPWTMFTQFQRGAAMGRTVASGAEGPALVNKFTGQAQSLGLGNPGIAVAEARAYANAKYSTVLVPEYDPNGQPTGRFRTTNKLEVLQTGSPTVSTPNMMTLEGKRALMQDIYGALENVRTSGSQIDWSGANRFLIAQALADSRTPSRAFGRSLIAQQLSPSERQYVVDVKVAQEAAQSLRPILGAGQGSDLQRQLGLATNPSAQTPDYDFLNRQLNGLEGMLERVGTGIPSLARPQQGNGAQPAQKGGGVPKPLRGATNQGNTGKFVVTAPNGKSYPFDTQEQADRFKKMAGIQ